jgi:NAD(P) transhydrogenase
VTRVAVLRDGRLRASVEGSRPLHADALLLATGRQGNGDLLGVENAGLKADARGHLQVDRDFRTAVPDILAAGDVIGGASLASTSAEQGRVAAERAFGREARLRPELLPAGIYTIPEVAMVGPTEQDLAAGHVPYEVGLAHFDELPRGRLLGGASGLLKLLFDRRDQRLLGVHIVGEGATELIHVGQTALALGGTIDTFADAVFGTPTFAEAYRAAARNGLDRL